MILCLNFDRFVVRTQRYGTFKKIKKIDETMQKVK